LVCILIDEIKGGKAFIKQALNDRFEYRLCKTQKRPSYSIFKKI